MNLYGTKRLVLELSWTRIVSPGQVALFATSSLLDLGSGEISAGSGNHIGAPVKYM